jgi:hypothetical protein
LGEREAGQIAEVCRYTNKHPTPQLSDTVVRSGVTSMSACNFVNDGDDLFVVYGGVRIAKRGRSGTPYAEQWIPLNNRVRRA